MSNPLTQTADCNRGARGSGLTLILLTIVAMLFAASAPSGAVEYEELYQFQNTAGAPVNPYGQLVVGSNGVLYGLALGGANNLGAAFSLTPPSSPGGSWTEDTIVNFSASYTSTMNGNNETVGGMALMDAAGNLY